MHLDKSIDIETDILEFNRKLAVANQKKLHEFKVYSIDVLGSIGAGKTTLIINMINRLKAKNKICGAIAGDVVGDFDYQRFKSLGIPVVNINTGKECHLTAHDLEHALTKLDLMRLDVLFIENVGNLVCPVDFPLGTDKRMVVVSVTEGDDMVKKHPLIFIQADVIVVNKIDLSSSIEVAPESIVKDANLIAPGKPVVCTDAKHGVGVDEVIQVLGLS